MFQKIQQYDLIEANGRWYRARAYGDHQPDGTWNGWLVFFPIGPGPAIAPPSPESTQSTFAELTFWADGLTPLYLDGALARALSVAEPASLSAHLADAEYEALEDAERLETAADVDRTSADIEEAAARAARADAEGLRRERLSTESAVAATEETAAQIADRIHEDAAREGRSVAADAARRRAAEAKATPSRRAKSRGNKKK
jgi:hypothetical protein